MPKRRRNIVWAKRRKDGGPDGRGVGFYFRNVTELILFGVKGKLRTGPAGRSQVNMIETRKREHSRKPDELYPLIEACSPGSYLEMFARYPHEGWAAWGNEAAEHITQRLDLVVVALCPAGLMLNKCVCGIRQVVV